MKKSTPIVNKLKLGLASGVLVTAVFIPFNSFAAECRNNLSMQTSTNYCKAGCTGAVVLGLFTKCMESCVYDTSGCPRHEPIRYY